MEGKGRTLKTALLVIAFLVVITGASVIFIAQMNAMIRDNMMNTVRELAEHDLVSIQNFLERNWNELEGIQTRMASYDCQTVQQVQERMNMERSSGDFHTLYLLDEAGNVYTDRYRIYSREELDIAQYLEGDREQIAVRYDYGTTTEDQKEMLLYAIRLENYEVDGIRFTALAGISNINQIQDRLALYSFYKDGESRGYTSVVNPGGDFIVNIRRTTSLNQRENLFEMIEGDEIESGWSVESIEEHMSRRESFDFYYTDSDRVERLLYFIPVEGVTWYLILVVEKTVFTDLSSSFILSSVSMVAIAVIVSIGTLLLLMHSNRKVLRANAEARARTDFLSNMSHEIRTPLNGIIGLLYLIRSHMRGEDRQVLDWMDKADDTAQYLLGLVSDILDMSKLQEGKLELISNPFLVEEVVDNVYAMQRGNVESRGVELVLEKELTQPCIIGDEVRLKQVLMNIVGNAAKFTPTGGTIRLSVRQLPVEGDRVTTVITCADTGIGMSPEFLGKIWDSFSQEHNKVSNGARGTGLGMAITKRIVDAMGGEITVESQLGEGSTFTVTLQAQVGQAPQLPAAENKRIEQGPEKPLKLLVAEDNPLNAEILMEILADEGFEAVLAENGQQAVELFAQSRVGEFNVILMDMQMPVMDGCQAAVAIREMDRPDGKEVLIFACTANSFQEDRDRALASGMNDFLTKPIDIDSLLSKLQHRI